MTPKPALPLGHEFMLGDYGLCQYWVGGIGRDFECRHPRAAHESPPAPVAETIVMVNDTSGWTREVAVAMWRQENAARLRILAALDAAKAEATGAIPCSDCGGNAREFAVSNEAWNALVRRDGQEQPGEYLCVRCFGDRALATLRVAKAEAETHAGHAWPKLTP